VLLNDNDDDDDDNNLHRSASIRALFAQI